MLEGNHHPLEVWVICRYFINTLEGFWSLLRSWLRPHRDISQEKLPNYIGFFEFDHNVRRRGKTLLQALLTTFYQPLASLV